MAAVLTNDRRRNVAGDLEVVSNDLGSRDDASLIDEIVRRACAVADGSPRTCSAAGIARPLLVRIDAYEARARRVSANTRVLAPAAALEFVGEAIAAAAIDGAWPEGAASDVVARVAEHLGASEAESALAVFRHAVSTRECAQLPSTTAVEVILSLVVELGAVVGISLWAAERPRQTNCLAAAGRAARSRRMRETARAALDGVLSRSEIFHVIVVERWEQPFAALVARSRNAHGSIVEALLVEAAAALGPVLERAALYERGVARERDLVAAGERRLVRLGFDLHDGPLQEIVAFANDLRLARSHIEPLLETDARSRAAGCFDDLTARLESLDRDLREIAHSVRSTTALDRPLQEALRREVETIRRAGVSTEFGVEGDLAGLTDSQKIVIYRVVQEALNNVRKHSGATQATVQIRSTARLIEVIVTDNGRGIDPTKDAESDRLGLAGVSERVLLLGGVVSVGAAASGGTRIGATLPQWRSSSSVSETTAYAATA